MRGFIIGYRLSDYILIPITIGFRVLVCGEICEFLRLSVLCELVLVLKSHTVDEVTCEFVALCQLQISLPI